MNKITFQENGHLYFNEHGAEVPSVSRILEYFGISAFPNVRHAVLEAARNFGRVVHQTCYLYDINDLAECDPNIQPYLDQWEKFKKDYCVSNFELIEQPLYSKVWGFAGTPDRLFDAILPDIKSGCKAPGHKIQTAFYQILIEENLQIKIKERFGVYLKIDDYEVVSHKFKFYLSVAKSLVQIYHWKKKEKLL